MKRTALFALFALSGSLHAQPAAVQQFNDQQQQRRMMPQQPLRGITTSTNAPELYPGENDDVGPQSILKLNARRTHWEFLADSQYLYTDNNRLAETGKIDTGLAINTVQAAMAPSAYPLGSGMFAPRVGVRSQWYNYGLGGESGEDVLDFNAQTAFIAGTFQYQQVWEFGAEVDYTRLLAQRNYDEFYTEWTPMLFVQRYIPISENLVLALSWQGMYHFTSVDPLPREDVNDRFDNVLGVTLSYMPIQKLALQPFYRFQHTYYPETALGDSRQDIFNIVGASVNYFFTRNFAARIVASGTFRESDDPFTSDYSKLDAGLGASFLIRF
jgi:hypothetical protein